MAKITINVDTEDAVRILLGVRSTLSGKALLADSGDNINAVDEWLSLKLLEDAVAIAVKAIDVDEFDGEYTKRLAWIEGSKE